MIIAAPWLPPQPSPNNSPTDRSGRVTSSVFAFNVSFRPGTYSSQSARVNSSSRRSLSARNRTLAPPTTTTSLSTSPFPVTPPDDLALEGLDAYVRSLTRAAEGAVDIRPNTASTTTPFSSAHSPTTTNIAPPFPPPSLSQDSNVRGEIFSRLSRCSSGRVSVGPEMKDVEALAEEKDSTITSARHPQDFPLQDCYSTDLGIGEEDSPYPEVRVCVSNTDDPDMPALTFRVWVIGLPVCLVGSCINAYSGLRPVGPYCNPIAVLLITYPMGKALAWALPLRVWIIPNAVPWVGGKEFSFNPCPFNIKEHALICVAAIASLSTPYASQCVLVIRKNYGISIGFPAALCFELASRLLGLSMVVMGQQLVVGQTSAIWPTILVYPTVLNTLHAELEAVRAPTIPRYRFFLIGSALAFVYNFLPGFLFTGLSWFSFICWIWPRQAVVNQLFGSVTGLGMSVLCLDWSMISGVYEPIYVPWWSQANVAFGFFLSCWVIAPAIYYSDVWKSGHLPISSSGAFDRFAQPYNISRVLSSDLRFNATAYAEYSPLYLTATFSVLYLAAFAVIPALFIHFALRHGPQLIGVILGATKRDEDIHARLMRQYKTVPKWWYMTIFGLCFASCIVSIKVHDIQTPVWMLLLALLLAAVSYLPLAFIMAWTGQPLSLNLMAEIIPGALLPGKPIANMVSKVYTVETVGMALFYTEAFKLGHYLKLPPRTVFVVAVSMCCCAQAGLYWWLLTTVPDLCSPNQPNHLTCPGARTFYIASVIWGTIGPRHQFGSGGVYNLEMYGLAVGAFLPLPFWLVQRQNPASWMRFINIPIILYGSAYVPSWGCLSYTSSFLVGFISQYLIKRRNFRWWAKYNYVLGAALDTGTSLSTMVIAAALSIPRGGKLSPAWWGNSVWTTTADAAGIPYLSTDPVEGF